MNFNRLTRKIKTNFLKKVLPKKYPLVSVCMIIKNGMPYLTESLNSILAQGYPNIELIIQDCCSNDGTLKIIDEFSKKVHFPVYLVSEPDNGVANALNKVWKRASGQIITLADADNFYLPDHIKTGVNFLKTNKNVSVAYTCQNIVDQNGNLLHKWTPDEYSFEKVINIELVPPSGSIFIQKNLLLQDLYYDENPQLGHVPDLEFWMRIGYKNYKIMRINSFTYCTRISDQSGSCQIFRYDEFIKSKSYAVQKIFQTYNLDKQMNFSLNKSLAGIYAWAAWHVYSAENCSERFKSYMLAAQNLDQLSEPYIQICKRSGYLPTQ